MTDEERIAQLTQDMWFERKPAVTPREKAAYAALESACEQAVRSLNKLRLRLWHAVGESGYRSLPMDEARAMLKEARGRIDDALAQCPQGEDKA